MKILFFWYSFLGGWIKSLVEDVLWGEFSKENIDELVG